MTCKKQLESKLIIINKDKLRLGVKKLENLQIVCLFTVRSII